MKRYKETIIRAVRTFFQAAVGCVAAHLAASAGGYGGGRETLKRAVFTLGASAIAAGLAAVMNLPADNDNDNEEDDPYNGR